MKNNKRKKRREEFLAWITIVFAALCLVFSYQLLVSELFTGDFGQECKIQ
jgi:hypothetical protein